MPPYGICIFLEIFGSFIYFLKIIYILNQIARLLTGEHGSVIPELSSVIVNQFGQ
jgi:hypothetical protein